MGVDQRDKDMVDRVGAIVSSPALGTLVGAAGLLITVFGWLNGAGDVKDALLAAETALVIWVVGTQMWLHGAYVRLRRANARVMADPAFFDAMRRQLEREITSGYEDIADGRLRVYATEVARVSVLLLRTLADCAGSAKVIRATDLTTDPRLLASRSEYLAENKRFIAAGGVIKRLFICRLADLQSREFADALLSLITQHRSIGVQCGLGVRERLRADQAIDMIIYGTGAVIIEDEQGDVDYTSGRSSIDFKLVGRWIDMFDSMWPGNGVPTPVMRLQYYETTVRQMLDEGRWDAQTVRRALDAVD